VGAKIVLLFVFRYSFSFFLQNEANAFKQLTNKSYPNQR
jgi:hypothetical protein